MPRFLVVAPHRPEDCLDVIEETIGMGPGLETAYDWGCRVGDHTGYVVVRADSAAEAVADYVPASLRAGAVAHRVERITGRDLRRMREERGA